MVLLCTIINIASSLWCYSRGKSSTLRDTATYFHKEASQRMASICTFHLGQHSHKQHFTFAARSYNTTHAVTIRTIGSFLMGPLAVFLYERILLRVSAYSYRDVNIQIMYI